MALARRLTKVYTTLRDKRDFDDEENESLSKGTLRHTHRRGILCDQKKYLNAKKDVSGEFFFPLFFRVLLV